ncbi:MAG TPA: PD-(D/E)XK nuclease family protein [Acidimicrobiales bacterium]|nr:PD-(D/E)XK nuclease family protein [Acidimicrobiales bacterium]
MAFEQPLPQSLSPSRLSDFQTCPRRYQHASIERLPQPASYATAKGRFIHFVLENLLLLDADQRTIGRAREYVTPAIEAILTDEVRLDIGLDDAVLARLVSETEAILVSYFEMEDPTTVTSEGVELRLGVEVNDTPLYGILDRLDRDPDGSLTIVDYKTGKLPNRNYDSMTFANTELYAALCEAKLGERPATIRLMYVAHGQSIERSVTDVVVKARANAAAGAWTKIKRYYDDGDFPATPSSNACRFCSFKDLCRSQGVPVPSR